MKKINNLTAIRKGIIFFLFLFFFGTGIPAAFAESKIVKGRIDEYSQTSIKVAGWYYSVCSNSGNPEHEGIWVIDKKGEEIDFDDLEAALEVKVYIDKAKNCVWKIIVLKFKE